MARLGPNDIANKLGPIDREIIDRETCEGIRRSEMADDILLDTVMAMMRRHAEDKAAQELVIWDLVAKKFGYACLADAHADGCSFSINHGRYALELRRRVSDEETGLDARP